MSKKFEIFISYRRKGGHDTAKLLYDKLKMDGYSVSFDIETLEKGYFDGELEKRVAGCKDFLLVLNPGVFDRLLNPDYDPEDDWVRRETACALKENKNIVPLFLEGFDYPKTLPDDIKDIKRKNSIELVPKHFEAAYSRMKRAFLLSKPHWAIRHKKKIVSLVSAACLVLAACLFFEISSRQNLDLELQKAKMEADSIITAKEAEIEHIADSIKQAYSRQMKQQAKKTEAKAEAASQKPAGKALYWGGPNSSVGQAVFKRIEEAGVARGNCLGDGVVIRSNDAKCEAVNDAMFECNYLPMLTITNCDGKLLETLNTSASFKTPPRESEAEAREELIKELNGTNFSDWVLFLKGLR